MTNYRTHPQLTIGSPAQERLPGGTFGFVDNLWVSLLDLVFPRRCVGCKKVGSLLCYQCRRRLVYLLVQRCVVCGEPAQGGFTHPTCLKKDSPERLICAFRYRDPLRQAMFQWKYRDAAVVHELLDSLLKEVCEYFQIYLPENFILVPIPLHRKRLKERGFNQSSLLAHSLALMFSRECWDDLLLRVKPTQKQMEIHDTKRRWENVAGAFALVSGREKEVSGRNFVLVDDVWTTGATCLAALKVLKEAGATSVWIFTLARGR